MKTPREIAVAFVEWTKLKLRIHLKESVTPYFNEREIWWIHLGANIGSEQNGKNILFERPVLVVRKFNQHLFWGIPTSTKMKSNKFYYRFHLGNVCFSAILSQMRPMSSKRLIRKVGMLNQREFDDICDNVSVFLKNDSRIRN